MVAFCRHCQAWRVFDKGRCLSCVYEGVMSMGKKGGDKDDRKGGKKGC